MKKQIILSLISLTMILMACGTEEKIDSKNKIETRMKAKSSSKSELNRLTASNTIARSKPSVEKRLNTSENRSTAKKASKIGKTITKGDSGRSFKGKTWDGKEVSLESLKGQYVLLDFWASWCPPCKKEIPFVKKLSKKYGNSKKFIIVGISLDRSQKSLIDFVKKNDMDWLNIYDADNGNIATTYGIRSIPYTVLIDPEGKVIATQLRGPAMLKEISGRLDS